jgi:RNA polymerase sigma-70 factor (ECF subfamily)
MNVASKNTRNHLEDGDPARQLVEKASAGCTDSFRQLVEQNHRRIRLYLGRYVQCTAEVDDIAQEVFLVAFSRLSNFRQESKFSTWLIGIARIKALEFLKSETKIRTSKRQFFEAEIAAEQIARLEKKHDQAERAERRIEAMQLCLEQLPHQSRALINRYYFDQQTAIDIAAKSDISAGSVRMKLLRIRQILHKCIVARSEDSYSAQTMPRLKNE